MCTVPPFEKAKLCSRQIHLRTSPVMLSPLLYHLANALSACSTRAWSASSLFSSREAACVMSFIWPFGMNLLALSSVKNFVPRFRSKA